ncbi:unnamed protein product [Arabidopsis halleri]
MMKLFSIFVVFIQIQIALSQPIRSTGPKLIQVLCKSNIYPSLSCVSTLNLDSRSKNSNLRGLASISIDATSKKSTSCYIISFPSLRVSKTVKT